MRREIDSMDRKKPIVSKWGQRGMSDLLEAVKKEKISSGVLILVATLAVYAVGFADERYVKKEDLTPVQEQIDRIEQVQAEHVEEFKIVSATNAISDIKRDIVLAQATGASESDILRLEDELEHKEEYKRCLVRQEPNCKHLWDAE